MEHVAVIPSLSPWSSLCLEKVFKDLPRRNPFEIALGSSGLVSHHLHPLALASGVGGHSWTLKSIPFLEAHRPLNGDCGLLSIPRAVSVLSCDRLRSKGFSGPSFKIAGRIGRCFMFEANKDP